MTDNKTTPPYALGACILAAPLVWLAIWWLS